jgi:hypothetical protein
MANTELVECKRQHSITGICFGQAALFTQQELDRLNDALAADNIVYRWVIVEVSNEA